MLRAAARGALRGRRRAGARQRRLGHRRHGRRGRPARRRPARARPDRRPGDPHRAGQRHRRRGDLLPPGHRPRPAGRRAGHAVHVGQLRERHRRAGRGAPPRAGHASRSSATTAAGSPPRRSPTTSSSPAPSTSPASRRRRRAPTTCSCELLGRRDERVRARVEGTVQGVGFRPYVHRAGARARAWRASCSTTRAACCSRSRARRCAALPRAPAGRGAAAGARRARARRGDPGHRRARLRHPRVARRRAPGRGDRARHGHVRRLPGRAVRPRRPPLPLPVHQLHQLRPALHDRPRHPVRPAAAPRWPASRCAPPAGPSTRTRPTAASTPSRTPAPDCGPHGRASLTPRAGAGDPVAAAAHALAAGAIVAVKGIGGFHLACRADDERGRGRAARAQAPRGPAVRADGARPRRGARARRRRRGRAARPASGRSSLRGAGRGAHVAPSVAPRSRELGVMLPYSPLHHLLLADAGVPLVMTSGNVSDEPIAYRDEDALERLAGIADLFLLHDRPIHTRTDDSVVRGAAGWSAARAGTCPRRSRCRGAPGRCWPCGAELKSTFCAGARRAAPGSATTSATCATTRRCARSPTGIAHFERLLRGRRPSWSSTTSTPSTCRPSTRSSATGVETLGVQHHHAHLAACLAEHGATGPAVGAIYDGTGYGTDGTVWGGEILLGGLRGFDARRPPVAGADARRRGGDPRALADGLRLARRGGDRRRRCPGVDPARWARSPRSPAPASPRRSRRAWAACSTPSPRSAACGRTVTYEGQAAIELEAAADPRERGAYADAADLDARPDGARRRDDIARGVPVAVVSARFHNALADATAAALLATGEPVAVVSGGVFQNALLLDAHDRAARGRRRRACSRRARCRPTTAASRTGRRRSGRRDDRGPSGGAPGCWRRPCSRCTSPASSSCSRRTARRSALGVGVGITAYTLGLRHAFDADHIAAIDNTTRKLMARGERPLSVGFFFSLGHSTIVFSPRSACTGCSRRLRATRRALSRRRHDGVRRVPLRDRARQPRCCSAGRAARRAVGAAAPAPMTRLFGRLFRDRRQAVAHVPRRPAVRARLRHRDRGGAAHAGRRRGARRRCRCTPSSACRSCSPPACRCWTRSTARS